MNLRAAKEIIQDGNPTLRGKAKHATKVQIGSRELKKLVADMRILLAREKNGVGLAAPQVGVPVALFIVAGRVFEEPEDKKSETKSKKSKEKDTFEPHPLDRVFINPELTRLSRKKKEMSEGCLSVRGIYGTVMRHEKASIKALDESGKPITMNAAGLLAHIFQHEVDHLNGILFIDKAVSIEDEKKRDRKATS